MYNIYNDSIQILMSNTDTPSYSTESANDIKCVLEDVNSPVTRKYQEKLYKSVMNKAHIDFGDIPKSKGNIKNYSGYATMCETLDTIEALAVETKNNTVLSYVNIVKTAIDNITNLSSTYEKGFTSKSEYVALEYDLYVYLCIEATTALIYSFVEVVKSPDKTTLNMTIKNTKLRADEFYFNQLKKFNSIQKSMGIDYRKLMETVSDKSKSNFVGAEVVGFATIVAAAMAIIPVTREVIYQIYSLRGKLSDNLDMQSSFLELNKSCVENNNLLTLDKKKKILDKQEKLIKKIDKLSDLIRVKSSKSILDASRDIKKDNGMLSINSIKDEVSNSPFELI